MYRESKKYVKPVDKSKKKKKMMDIHLYLSIPAWSRG